MKTFTYLLLACALFIQTAGAQRTTGTCCGPTYPRGPNYNELESVYDDLAMQETKIVLAVRENAKKCELYKLTKIEDIADVYSILSIEKNSKKEDCEKEKACLILTSEIKVDLKTFFNSNRYHLSSYLGYYPKTTIPDPKKFIKDFKTLLNQVSAE